MCALERKKDTQHSGVDQNNCQGSWSSSSGLQKRLEPESTQKLEVKQTCRVFWVPGEYIFKAAI